MADAVIEGNQARIEKSMLQDKAQESPADEAELDLA